jgi:hypothetical protein
LDAPDVDVRHPSSIGQVADDVAARQLLGHVLARAEHEERGEQAEASDRRVDGDEVGVQRHGDWQAVSSHGLRVQRQLDGDVVEADQE